MERQSDQIAPDVLVVGGGILGLATSCELLSRGHTVSIVERDPAGSATRAAGGMLSPWAEFSAPAPWQSLLVQARNAYPEFVRNAEETSGCRVECRFPGTLLVSPDPEFDLSDLTFTFREQGARATYLDSEDLTRVEPGLSVDSAILLEDEGYVDPRGLHSALRASFEELGGLWIRDEVYAIREAGGRVVGVRTSSGDLSAGAVLNTAGVQADRFLLPEDRIRLEPRPVRGELLRLRPPRRGERIRHVIQSPGFAYLIPQDDGTVIVGATSYEGDGTRRLTARGVAELLENAAGLLPDVSDWEWVEAWSGVRPLVGNGEPTVLTDPRPGLFHGLGLYRNGILLAPVIGAQLSRLATEYVGLPGSRPRLESDPRGDGPDGTISTSRTRERT
ncbi:MAG: FAD-dependent oxidoreductase [Candidatus Eisenbacteria bacterium]